MIKLKSSVTMYEISKLVWERHFKDYPLQNAIVIKIFPLIVSDVH